MEWNGVEAWKRHWPYVAMELRKDAPDYLARLGLATSFALVVGVAEGARVSGLRGDVKFPLRYAIYNVMPSFVGGKVSPSSVASAMASAPPLRVCPRAAAHVANLRALRTAVAGCSVLSVIFQVALASSRGTEAYAHAVAEGREVPSLYSSGGGSKGSGTGGVVRLCGAGGLESALRAARRGEYRPSILPVVISGFVPDSEHCSGSSSSAACLPDGALAAVAACSPRPCYYRIDAGRLFCREAWRPVTIEIAESAGVESREIFLIVETDALSSLAPQSLLASPVRDAAGAECDSERQRTRRLGAGQAVWGLAMLRTTLEDERRSGGESVASVVLSERRLGGPKASAVSIDARAALLLSVHSWAQQCAAEAASVNAETTVSGSSPGDTVEAATVAVATEGVEGSIGAAKAAGKDPAGTGSADGTDAEGEAGVGTIGEAVEYRESLPVIDSKAPSRVARVLGLLERVGSGVRVLVAPDGRVRSAVNRSLDGIYAWLEKTRSRARSGGEESRVLLYDTDDEESFRWLAAQMLRQGWTVRRASDHRQASERSPEGSNSDAPILVHRCSDEETLTAAAGYFASGSKGPPMCAVVHRWDAGVEARRLLLEARAAAAGASAGRHVSTEVICTAEMGEGLFQFVRGQLQSGVTTGQVQEVLDDLFGAFYEAGLGEQH